MDAIAIIGLSCLFPGAHSPDQFWQNLLQEVDSTTVATAAEMGVDPDIFYDASGRRADTYRCKRGGYIRDFTFDASGYNLDAETLAGLDDVNRWSLYVAREALKDSGYLGRLDVLKSCGVFLGNLSFPTKASNLRFLPLYAEAVESALSNLLETPLSLPGLPQAGHPVMARPSPFAPAAAIAQGLSLSGVALGLDAACASSLYAVKLACDALYSGQADLMLAGAVSGADPFFINMGFSSFQAYPEDCVSRPLDRASGGLIAGEGAGMFVLKRYADALGDGDHIYAAIRGIGLSNDGKGKSLLSPHPKGQRLAYERAYAAAGVDPKSIDYIECHATGTPLGDQTELDSMEAYFGQADTAPLVGSVKSNFGHLLTAAGMASMLKVILSMNRGQIPATIKVADPIESANRTIAGEQIVDQRRPWPAHDRPKRAAVNAFGFGGTNAHLILEEATPGLRTSGGPIAVGQPQIETDRSDPNRRLAIIGMDAHFADSDGLDALSRTIYDGVQQMIPLPPQRWKGIEARPQDRAQSDHFGGAAITAPQGGYIADFELDFLKFGVPPSESDRPIAQQLLMLKVADRAIADAGLAEGANVAVIVGMDIDLSLHRFRGRCDLVWQIEAALARQGISLAQPELDALIALAKESVNAPANVVQYTSFIGNIMASRISAQWDFSGPAFTVSALENSTFLALETAERLLANGEVDAVVVGAVDLAGGPEAALLHGRTTPRMVGEAESSENEADASARIGEGAGAVVLKGLEQARENDDAIYAVIDAISLVRSQAPDGGTTQAIRDACRTAFQRAGVQPEDIGYLELSGRGLAVQDEAEICGIVQGYGPSEKGFTCAVGSVEANIGHTQAASGMASLIKSALVLDQRFVPAAPGWPGAAHPQNWGDRFYVPTESRPWLADADENPRGQFAAVCGIGADGVAAHLIMAAYRDEAASPKKRPSRSQANDYLTQTAPYLFLLAAGSQLDLLAQIDGLEQAVLSEVETQGELFALAQRCFQQYERNKEAGVVLALVSQHKTGLLEEIQWARTGVAQAFAASEPQKRNWKTPAGSAFAANPLGATGQVAFVYPGIFNSYIGLGRDLFRLFPQLHVDLEAMTPRPSALLAERYLYPRSLDRPADAKAGIVTSAFMDDGHAMLESSSAFAILFTKVLRDHFGLRPDAAFGYSLGESTMLLALGAWPVREAERLAFHNSPLFHTRLGGPKDAVRELWHQPVAGAESGENWQIHTLRASPSEVRAVLQQEERVYLTQINAPKEVVIAGDPSSCARVIAALAAAHVRAPFNFVIHCPPAASEHAEFVRLNERPLLPTNGINFLFAADEGHVPFKNLTSSSVAHRIADGACRQLDFPRQVCQAYDAGVRVFVEMGARSTCSRWIDDILGNREHAAAAINHTRLTDRTSLVHLLAQLASQQVALDLSPLFDVDAEASTPARSFVKTVTLGGARIADTILTAENRRRFGAEMTRIQDAASVQIAPIMTEPILAEPVMSEPAVAAPIMADPTMAEPMMAKPVIAEPMAVEPVAFSSNQPSGSIARAENNMHPTSFQPDNHGPVALPEAESALPAGDSTPLQQQIAALGNQISLVTQSHKALLTLRHASAQHMAELIRMQVASPAVSETAAAPPREHLPLPTDVLNGVSPNREHPTQAAEQRVVAPDPQRPTPLMAEPNSEPASDLIRVLPSLTLPDVQAPADKNLIWDEADLIEFAEGKIANVFGPDYASIDGYTRRVRLPMPPYLLVSRVTELDAERGNYRPSTMQTEYDIPVDAWYSVDGQTPTAVAVESGQCDLLLISYIGIDFENRGALVYRLLDCTLTFLGDLPHEGQTLRYDISINAYARNGDNLLFFFSYNCYADDKLILEMRNGCAGFFSDEDLAQGRGIVVSESERAQRASIRKTSFEPLLACRKSSFSKDDLTRLSHGDLAGCFGHGYAKGGQNPSLRFPDPQMVMLDRVTEVDVTGGPWGLGWLRAEKDLAPDDWYFPCHFKDDEVLAGSLMAEGCVQLLELYMLHLGMQTATTDARFQPIPGLEQVVRCRGQVTPEHTRLIYELEVTEIGMTPQPHVKANVSLILDGKTVVDFRDLGLQLVEKDPSQFTLVAPAASATPDEPVVGGNGSPTNQKAPLFNEAHISEFATGSLSNCFGPDFDVYENRRTSRTPSGDLQLMSRVLDFEGERFQFNGDPGPSLVSEYDLPASPWFLPETLPPVIPYSIYMEIGLQPCGFLSAHLGSTLLFPEEDFHFRNLDGSGVLLATPDLRGKTIRNRARLRASTAIAGVIIQDFEYELTCEGTPFFRGDASFGYFTAQALADQRGLDSRTLVPPWIQDPDAKVGERFDFRLQSPPHHEVYYGTQPGSSLHLPAGQLDFLDECTLVPNGGREGMGYIHSRLRVSPEDWFFACHFYQDPVMPGSLGVEAIMQALKVFARQRNLGQRFSHPHFSHRVNHETRWKYRGQIVPGEGEVELEVHITAIDDTGDQIVVTGDASLWKQGLRIYEVSQASICIQERPPQGAKPWTA